MKIEVYNLVVVRIKNLQSFLNVHYKTARKIYLELRKHYQLEKHHILTGDMVKRYYVKQNND